MLGEKITHTDSVQMALERQPKKYSEEERYKILHNKHAAIISSNCGNAHKIRTACLKKKLTKYGANITVLLPKSDDWIAKKYNLSIEKNTWSITRSNICANIVMRLPHRILKLLQRGDIVPVIECDFVISAIGILNSQIAEIYNHIPIFITTFSNMYGERTMYVHDDKPIYLDTFMKAAINNAKLIKNRAYACGFMVDDRFLTPDPDFVIPSINGFVYDSAKPVILVMFGGVGSNLLYDLAQKYANHPQYQFVFVCGRSQDIQRKINDLVSQTACKNILNLGYVTNLVDYMHNSNIILTKAGDQTVSELCVTRLPVIFNVAKGQCLEHERTALEFLEQNKLGVAIRDWNEVDNAIKQILANPTMFQEAFDVVLHKYPANGLDNAIDAICDTLSSK